VLSEISDVSLKCLSPLLHQGLEGGHGNVAPIEVGSIVAGVSTLHT
jgi:hypothetical protein